MRRVAQLVVYAANIPNSALSSTPGVETSNENYSPVGGEDQDGPLDPWWDLSPSQWEISYESSLALKLRVSAKIVDEICQKLVAIYRSDFASVDKSPPWHYGNFKVPSYLYETIRIFLDLNFPNGWEKMGRMNESIPEDLRKDIDSLLRDLLKIKLMALGLIKESRNNTITIILEHIERRILPSIEKRNRELKNDRVTQVLAELRRWIAANTSPATTSPITSTSPATISPELRQWIASTLAVLRQSITSSLRWSTPPATTSPELRQWIASTLAVLDQWIAANTLAPLRPSITSRLRRTTSRATTSRAKTSRATTSAAKTSAAKTSRAKTSRAKTSAAKTSRAKTRRSMEHYYGQWYIA